MKGEGAGAPPGVVTDPFEDPPPLDTPVGAALPVGVATPDTLAATDAETLLPTAAVADPIADPTDALRALLEV